MKITSHHSPLFAVHCAGAFLLLRPCRRQCLHSCRQREDQKKRHRFRPDSRARRLGGSSGESAERNDLERSDVTWICSASFPPRLLSSRPAAAIAPNTFKMSGLDEHRRGVSDQVGREHRRREHGRRGLSLRHVWRQRSSRQTLCRSRSDPKTIAHTFANNIVEALTGLPGIFLTKIAISCDRTGKKEIYVMNFDGTEVKQVTRHRSIAFAPAWSPGRDENRLLAFHPPPQQREEHRPL